MAVQIIALDYDDTFSLDPEGWSKALPHLIRPDRVVWGVTARNRGQLIQCPLFNAVCSKVLYCCGQAKLPLVQSFGAEVAYWIDDKPEYIHRSYADVHGRAFIADPGDDTLTPWLVSLD